MKKNKKAMKMTKAEWKRYNLFPLYLYKQLMKQQKHKDKHITVSK